MVWTYLGGASLSFRHLTPCLWSIQIIGRLFLNPYFSCFLYVCSVCLRRFIFQVKKKKKQFIGLNFTILRSIFYSRNVLSFKPKYIHFVYSFLAYVAFSSCLRSEDQFVVAVLVFFFSRGARGHAVVIVNDPFSDLPFFWWWRIYDLRS